MLSAFTQGLLKVDPGLFLWTLISFGILLLILWKTAWRPIIGALDARAVRIRKDLESAETSRKEAEEMFHKHKAMIEYARDEALKIVVEGRSDAERVKNDIIDKANAEAQSIVDRAHREIDLAKEKAIVELRSELVDLSTQIAAKVIERNLTAADQKRIVEDELSKLV
ncbi:MAG TPA: F0F1 ATP synthase subunit B [Spirochaetota bacterium]